MKETGRNLKTLSEAVIAETEKIIVGKTDEIRMVLMAVLADGHVLLEDLPGSGKTTLVKTLSRAQRHYRHDHLQPENRGF